ncbi:hypothetical protein [Alkalilimnicola sp. S0819]|uniref:hypothetical protein n=1 Tax=Alkalilimnicola sp. S0819 TaxID=2613922 RepID=UPI001261C85D|nr:hypothetical protein [Alkalilimnicola sp. S0819]KAB7624149.1 hypothetical protein F3N43_07105 [Alkalilimnicola sp. S0819]MPQ16402.1 hypothetical protein [Alkalilimnicola sp. S0819]
MALDEMLRGHLLEPEHLRNDDFEAFYRARMAALTGLVAEARGKPVVEVQGAEEAEVELDMGELDEGEVIRELA